MTSRYVNIAILVLLALEFASGVGGFLAGRPSARWVFWLHSAGGFALVVLIAWKWRIVLRSFRHRGGGAWAAMPVVLTVLFLGSLGTGLLWATTGLPSVPLPPAGRVSGLTLHVVLSVAMAPLLLAHLMLRWPRPRRAGLADRRAALRSLAVLGGGVVAWQATEAAARVLDLSGAGRRFTGSREEGSFAGNAHPVTNWLTDTRQRIDRDAWRLRIHGAVEAPREVAYDELLSGEQVEQAVLDCTGGWYTVQRWRGVPLAALLDPARPLDGARSVVVRSATGYDRRFDIGAARRLLLATHVEDEPLSAAHGFPARLVAPGHRGYHWVKWVVEVEVSERPAWWQPPLPVQ